jgi:hypothetical protein
MTSGLEVCKPYARRSTTPGKLVKPLKEGDLDHDSSRIEPA